MKINEIFKSIQGETTFAGVPSVFIRTTGCNLRCSWCDTKYAYSEGEEYTSDDLVKVIEKFNCGFVVITGGEPMEQEDTPVLAERLIKDGYKVLVETNGSKDISILPSETFRIVDVKCPSSNMTDRMLWENIQHLSSPSHDEVKFVITDYNDYVWAKSILKTHKLNDICTVLFSPAFGLLNPAIMADWIINDNLPVRMQLQLHKYIWGTDARGK